MYKIHNDLSPSYLRWIFANTSNVNSHNLRNFELNCYVPSPDPELSLLLSLLHYRGSVPWKKIPSEIRNLLSLDVFKTSFHGKDYLNAPWLIVTLIIHAIKNLFMFSVRISSYECAREVWRARKTGKSCTRRLAISELRMELRRVSNSN